MLKEMNPEYTLEELMLKLKLQDLVTYFEELTHWKRPWCYKRLRRSGRQRMRWLDGVPDSMDISLSKPWETTKDQETCCAAVHWVTKRVQHNLATEQQQHLHTAFSSCLLPSSLPPFLPPVDWKKDTTWELWIKFSWGKMRTPAWETAFLRALRNCSKEELLPDLQFCSFISENISVSC